MMSDANPDIGALVAFARARQASNNYAYGAGSYADVVVENARELYYLYTAVLVRGPGSKLLRHDARDDVARTAGGTPPSDSES